LEPVLRAEQGDVFRILALWLSGFCAVHSDGENYTLAGKEERFLFCDLMPTNYVIAKQNK
jgi:hypothetical protein